MYTSFENNTLQTLKKANLQLQTKYLLNNNLFHFTLWKPGRSARLSRPLDWLKPRESFSLRPPTAIILDLDIGLLLIFLSVWFPVRSVYESVRAFPGVERKHPGAAWKIIRIQSKNTYVRCLNWNCCRFCGLIGVLLFLLVEFDVFVYSFTFQRIKSPSKIQSYCKLQ